jgi:hypothetical protein
LSTPSKTCDLLWRFAMAITLLTFASWQVVSAILELEFGQSYIVPVLGIFGDKMKN